jgi:hypothetical protein
MRSDFVIVASESSVASRLRQPLRYVNSEQR